MWASKHLVTFIFLLQTYSTGLVLLGSSRSQFLLHTIFPPRLRSSPFLGQTSNLLHFQLGSLGCTSSRLLGLGLLMAGFPSYHQALLATFYGMQMLHWSHSTQNTIWEIIPFNQQLNYYDRIHTGNDKHDKDTEVFL